MTDTCCHSIVLGDQLVVLDRCGIDFPVLDCDMSCGAVHTGGNPGVINCPINYFEFLQACDFVRFKTSKSAKN